MNQNSEISSHQENVGDWLIKLCFFFLHFILSGSTDPIESGSDRIRIHTPGIHNASEEEGIVRIFKSKKTKGRDTIFLLLLLDCVTFCSRPEGEKLLPNDHLNILCVMKFKENTRIILLLWKMPISIQKWTIDMTIKSEY